MLAQHRKMEASRSTLRSFGQKIISYLADNEAANDVTFLVGSTGEEILALKVALQAACPALDRLFKNNWYKYWEKGNLRVPLPEVDPDAFRIFLKILLWDVLEDEKIQRLNLPSKTILHLVKISKKLQMAEMDTLFSAHIQIQGYEKDLETAGQLNSFDLELRNRNQKPDLSKTCAPGLHSSTTGVRAGGSMSVVGNIITVIGTSAHVPIFIPPVTYFYEIEPPSPSFTGRTTILTTIHSRMHVCSRYVKWNERTVVLCGLGGIGKTEIARMYAREFKSESFIKNVAWIDAENSICLKRSFKSLAMLLNVSKIYTDDLDAIVTGVYKHFSEHIGNGLLIFDNAPQFNDGEFQILNYLPTCESLERRPLVLITSRDQVWEDIPPENKINVHELLNDESIALFTKKLKLRLDQQSWNNKNAILKLAEAFQGFPLGLSLAASNIDYLDESDLENEIEEYLKRMEMPQGGWGDDTQSGAATKYSLVMKNVWEITLIKIKAKERDGGDAIKLLNLMAFSPTENMTVASMSEVFEFVFGRSVTTKSFAVLKKKSMISIETLSGSLATTVKSIGKQTQKIIKIHKLVQQCTRDNLNKNDAYLILTKICNYVSNRKLNNDVTRMTSALVCAHNYLKIRKWPQDSICYSVIFCSLMIFIENGNSDILFQLVRDVHANLRIEGKELVDMQTEDKAINLFCLCLIWINKHNDIYPGFKTLSNNRALKQENFENAVSSFTRHGSQVDNNKTNNMKLHELQNYLYNHCYNTLYTLMAAEKEQRILNASTKAVLKYRSIMESVMDDEDFKSDDILENTSKIAKKDAFDKFNSLCIPTRNNELTADRAELTKRIQIIFGEFQSNNNKKTENAKALLCVEAAKFCQSYADLMIAQTEYPFITEAKLQALHAEITLKLTEEFKQTCLDSPLLKFALQHLTEQLNTKHQAVRLEYKKVIDSANEVSAQALDCYIHRTKDNTCCNFNELSNVHNTAKTAAIQILKKSNLIHPEMLPERLTSLDSEIDSIYIQLICSLDKQCFSEHLNSTLNLKNALSSTCSTSVAIGIDFGTSFCRVAVLRHSHEDPKILKIGFARSTLSYVSYLPTQVKSQNTDPQVFIGETAMQLGAVNPEYTVYGIKRLIGRSFYEEDVERCKQLWPFHLVNVAGHVEVQISEKQKIPHEIASELLRYLKETSEDFLRSPIHCAVVTIPVYYSEIQKCLTEWACHAAGFKNINFIAEPVAAAFAYCIKSSHESHDDKTCLIYDLGGGTFNVTVFRLDAKNCVEIKATGGDDRLGGEDFNDMLMEFCIDEFKNIHRVNLAEKDEPENSKVLKIPARKLHQLRNECELQKQYLGSLASVVISLENIHDDTNLLVTVTRSKFEQLIVPLLNRSIKTLDETLKKSGCKKEEIDDVILIGGSSRIPKVQQMVQEYFAGKPICRTIDADEAVACGTAVHAYNVFKENAAPFSVVTLLKESWPYFWECSSPVNLLAAALLLEMIRWGNKINGFPAINKHAAVAVGNLIYSFGGVGHYRDPSYSRDVLDVFVLNVHDWEKKWRKLSFKNSRVKPNQRHGHSAVAHKEFVIIFGGFDAKNGNVSNSTYLFNTQTGKWDKPKFTGNVPRARRFHCAVVIGNEMLIYGGIGDRVTNDLHSLHLETFRWSTIETNGISPSLREGHSATVHDDRFILIFGGFDSEEDKLVNTIYSFDVNSKTWTAVKTNGTPPLNRRDHCACKTKYKLCGSFKVL